MTIYKANFSTCPISADGNLVSMAKSLDIQVGSEEIEEWQNIVQPQTLNNFHALYRL
jgi:hypothetical protein